MVIVTFSNGWKKIACVHNIYRKEKCRKVFRFDGSVGFPCAILNTFFICLKLFQNKKVKITCEHKYL